MQIIQENQIKQYQINTVKAKIAQFQKMEKYYRDLTNLCVDELIKMVKSD